MAELVGVQEIGHKESVNGAAAPPLYPRRVYPLDARSLSEEQIAVALAMTSRRPDPFDEIARQVSQETAAGFHERWVVGYGHASVAEHAVRYQVSHGNYFHALPNLAPIPIGANPAGRFPNPPPICLSWCTENRPDCRPHSNAFPAAIL